MLKEFRIKNFKSINEEQIFSMEACPKKEVSEYPDHVLNIHGERLLKVSSFYGPNGGGKTTIIDALITISRIIQGRPLINLTFGTDSEIPCKFSESKETTAEMFFVTEKYEIGYSFVANLSGTRNMIDSLNGQTTILLNPVIIREEMVLIEEDGNQTIIFERDERGVVKSDLFKNIDIVKSKRSLQSSLTFLSYFAKTFDRKTNEAIFELYDELKNILVLNKESNCYYFSADDVAILNPNLNKVVEILNGFDFRIQKLGFKQFGVGKYVLCVDRLAKDGKKTSIQFINESSGTRKIINLLFDVVNAKKSAVFIADDFDSHLHPKLIRAIIELFTSEKNINKQLIFNSHDITNMNNLVFRRDEIWFAYRDDNYASQYVPLSSIVNYKGEMVRKDAKYGKQYLEGKYGADPFIKQGLSWSK